MRRTAPAIALLISSLPATAAPPQVLLHLDGPSATTARARTLVTGAIGTAGDLFSTSSAARALFARRSPNSSTIAIGALDLSGNFTLRLRTDDGTGSSVSVASSVPAVSPAPIGAAYLSPSGSLVLAYATSGSADCTLRTYGTSLSGAVPANLGLATIPVRIEVESRAGSDEVLIVAQDSSQRLAATVWNGTTFRATQVLDSAYTGGATRWGCAWTRSGSPVVAWARSGDTALRVRELVDGTWETTVGTPMVSSAITRVELATDPVRRLGGAAVAMVSGTGTLDVATFDGESWSSCTTMTSSLDTTTDQPMDLAFEGEGSGLVCAWVASGADRATVRRRDASGSWNAAATTALMGTGIKEVHVSTEEGRAGALVLARVTSGSAGTGSGGLSDYVVYSSRSTVSDGDRVVYTGLMGGQVSGVRLPTAPTATIGTTDITLNHDQTQTLAPGNYRDLSFGDRVRINFSAGTYVFRTLALSGHDGRFSCNTSAGDVRIIFTESTVEFRDRFRIERSGTGIVTLNVLAGAFRYGHDAVMEAVLIAHAGLAYGADRSRLTGHLFARDSITTGHDGIFTLPTWSMNGSAASMSHRLYAVPVAAGSIGSLTELTSSPISGADAPPFAINLPSVAAPPRVVRWRETQVE